MPFCVRSDGFSGRSRLPLLSTPRLACSLYLVMLGCDGNVSSIRAIFVAVGAISSQTFSNTLLVSSCWSHGVQLEKSDRIIRERNSRMFASDISIIL
jgi:hypothetical protein